MKMGHSAFGWPPHPFNLEFQFKYLWPDCDQNLAK